MKRIDAEVERAKNNERLSVEFMKYWADREDLEDEAEARGLLKSIKALMTSMKWSVEQAMDALQIPDIDRKKYKEALV